MVQIVPRFRRSLRLADYRSVTIHSIWYLLEYVNDQLGQAPISHEALRCSEAASLA
jgi:hypothetical protein